MKRIGAFVLVSLMGPWSAIVAQAVEEPAGATELAENVRAILEQIESGELSVEELTAILLMQLAEGATWVLSPNLSAPEPFVVDARVDPSVELDKLPSTPVGGDSAISVNGRPVAVLSGPLVISAAAFTPDGFDPDSNFFAFGGGYWAGNLGSYGCLVAPAYLPPGVTVTDMFSSVYDNDASRDVILTLSRVNNFTGVTATLATTSTSGQFAGVQVTSDGSIDTPLVVYPDYSYYLTVCLGSNTVRLYSVRLYFAS